MLTHVKRGRGVKSDGEVQYWGSSSVLLPHHLHRCLCVTSKDFWPGSCKRGKLQEVDICDRVLTIDLLFHHFCNPTGRSSWDSLAAAGPLGRGSYNWSAGSILLQTEVKMHLYPCCTSTLPAFRLQVDLHSIDILCCYIVLWTTNNKRFTNICWSLVLPGPWLRPWLMRN